MRVAYVDTSCLVAIALGEPGARKLSDSLRRFDRLVSSNLLEAEFRSAMSREGVIEGVDDFLSWLSWVFPDRALTQEIAAVLEHDYLRGADLWHVACALYLAGDPKEISFVSLDGRQATVAASLGFRT